MPRTFAYLHVSTIGQPTDNQLQEIGAAGFKVELRRVAGVHLIQRSEDSRGCAQADLPSLRRAAVKLRAFGGWRRELSTKVSRHEPDMRGHRPSQQGTPARPEGVLNQHLQPVFSFLRQALQCLRASH